MVDGVRVCCAGGIVFCDLTFLEYESAPPGCSASGASIARELAPSLIEHTPIQTSRRFSMLPFAVADMFLIRRSSIATTAWFLLIAQEALCIWSFRTLAIREWSFVIRALALRQFAENFTFLANRRCNVASRRWILRRALAPSKSVPSDSAKNGDCERCSGPNR